MISAVMPTLERRRHFWPAAVKCFAEQTIHLKEQCELVIVDEAKEPTITPLAADAISGVFQGLVRYVHLPVGAGEMLFGSKRNVANAHARSDSMGGQDIILHWDDDDWSHPERIATQVRILREPAAAGESGKQVTGYHDLLYYRPEDRSFWKYVYQHPQTPYITDTTACYYRSWWEQHRFPAMGVGADNQFSLEAGRLGQLASMDGYGMVVARAHAGNSYQPRFGVAPFLPADPSMFPKEFLETCQS